jgi:RNase P protein component
LGAHQRNRLRRAVFETIRSHAPQNTPNTLFILAPQAFGVSKQELGLAVRQALRDITTHHP